MDDLLDLDFSKSSSNKPTTVQANYGSGRTAFDYLAQSSHRTTSPNPPLRPQAPFQPTRANSGHSNSSNGSRPTVKTGGNAGGDAFSSLFGTSPSATGAAPPSDRSNALSMAERLARDNAARFGTASSAVSGVSPSIGTSGFSRSSSPALQPSSRTSSPSLPTPPTRSSAPSPNPPPPSSSLRPPPASASEPVSSTASADPWDFDLLATSVPSSNPNNSKADDPFDLGFDKPSAPSATAATVNPTTSQSDDFDLLGAFSQPPQRSRASASAAPPPAPSSSSPSRPRAPARTSSSRSSSPPRPLVSRIVEMGFDPARARQALVATRRAEAGSGEFNLEAALESLMTTLDEPASVEPSTTRRKGKSRDEDEWGDDENVRVGRRRSWEVDEDDETFAREVERRRRERANGVKPNGSSAPVEARGQRRTREGETAATAAAARESERDQAKVLQDQAAEVLAQAQKIGFGMFKSANAYWGAGKEALAKKLDEQRAAARVAAGLPAGSGLNPEPNSTSGRPKWWKEGMEVEGDDATRTEPPARRREPPARDGFKDSDDETDGPESVLPQRPTGRQAAAPHRAQATAPPPANAEYRSPFRRAKPTAAAAPPQPPVDAAPIAEVDLLSGTPAPAALGGSRPRPSPTSSLARPAAARATPSSTPTRRAVARPLASVSAPALSTALAHKSTGNDHFKLGRFGDATAAYGLALDALPSDWVGRVPLLNNRAQSRLKSGEEKAATDDCTEAVGIVLGPYGGAIDVSALEGESATVSSEVKQVGGESFDLRDQVGKALGRRARGLEANEKWALAAQDWETVRNQGDDVVMRGAGGVKVVSEGIARCRKMLGGANGGTASQRPSPVPGSTTSARTPPPPRPKPRPSPRPPVEGSGEAVAALQASRAAASAEDDLRLSLKDGVDARIVAWKGGKETNLRALIASLDTVLWSELGWTKVGMHELISDGQLKVKYVRAIAKVHPDKLNVSNTTVEQRMIAQSVFAALNDAWNSTKA
ncbi:hypothetical protein JCM10212_004182 [Sporobolomyces blumeae]